MPGWFPAEPAMDRRGWTSFTLPPTFLPARQTVPRNPGEASEGSSAPSPRAFSIAGSRVHSCQLRRHLASLHCCTPAVRPAAALPRAAPPAHPVLPGERVVGTQGQAGSFRSLNPSPGAAAAASRRGALPAAARLSPVFSPAASFVGAPRAPPRGEYAPCSPRCSRRTGTDVGFSSARC